MKDFKVETTKDAETKGQGDIEAILIRMEGCIHSPVSA